MPFSNRSSRLPNGRASSPTRSSPPGATRPRTHSRRSRGAIDLKDGALVSTAKRCGARTVGDGRQVAFGKPYVVAVSALRVGVRVLQDLRLPLGKIPAACAFGDGEAITAVDVGAVGAM